MPGIPFIKDFKFDYGTAMEVTPLIRRVVAIDPATGTKTVIASNLDIGLASYPGGPPALVPTGVAVGRTGTVYVSSDIRNALYKLTPPTR